MYDVETSELYIAEINSHYGSYLRLKSALEDMLIICNLNKF